MIYKTIKEYNHGCEEPIGVVIGNFDGVHLGHQLMLKEFVTSCASLQLKPVLLTFSPHPALFLDPKKEHFLLCNPEVKKQLLFKSGIQDIVELEFTKELQSLCAKSFLSRYLLKLNHLQFILLGHDFRLGVGKESAKELLQNLLVETDIKMNSMPAVKKMGKIVSSTHIRALLKAGDITQVNENLNRPYQLMGKVINGYGVGKKELVPTANTEVDSQIIYPKIGVYFTQVVIANKEYQSVTNIGYRPSLQDNNDLSIETHILNFNDDLYEQELSVEFLKFHREEMKFSSKEDLLMQIKKDIQARTDFK